LSLCSSTTPSLHFHVTFHYNLQLIVLQSRFSFFFLPFFISPSLCFYCFLFFLSAYFPHFFQSFSFSLFSIYIRSLISFFLHSVSLSSFLYICFRPVLYFFLSFFHLTYDYIRNVSKVLSFLSCTLKL